MARILPTLVVLALLGCTAAAFAVTEGLKLEKSTITDTHVSKVVAPDSASDSKASIQFLLRKPDRLTVEIVNGSGEVVRTLARSVSRRHGVQQFTWDGRDDTNRVVPDGSYRPRVHLAREHRTILLPNPIRMDATAPLVRLVSLTPRRFSPDGDNRFDLVRLRYQTSEKARVILYVDGDRKTFVHDYLRAGKLDWGGKAARGLRPGPHRLWLRAFDFATNVGPSSRVVKVDVRYIDLRPTTLRVKTGARFGVRVLTDAKQYSVHLAGRHLLRSGRILYLRAPAKPGRYLLRVAEHGHVGRARVVVHR